MISPSISRSSPATAYSPRPSTAFTYLISTSPVIFRATSWSIYLITRLSLTRAITYKPSIIYREKNSYQAPKIWTNLFCSFIYTYIHINITYTSLTFSFIVVLLVLPTPTTAGKLLINVPVFSACSASASWSSSAELAESREKQYQDTKCTISNKQGDIGDPHCPQHKAHSSQHQPGFLAWVQEW